MKWHTLVPPIPFQMVQNPVYKIVVKKSVFQLVYFLFYTLQKDNDDQWLIENNQDVILLMCHKKYCSFNIKISHILIPIPHSLHFLSSFALYELVFIIFAPTSQGMLNSPLRCIFIKLLDFLFLFVPWLIDILFCYLFICEFGSQCHISIGPIESQILYAQNIVVLQLPKKQMAQIFSDMRLAMQ